MQILLTNLSLRGRTGTEAVIRDLALNLAIRGHEPIVFARRLGAPAEELRRKGVRVTDDLDSLRGRPDIIHGQHNIPAVAAMVRFPSVPAVWMSHDTRNWFDAPPLLRRVHRYIAVDQLRIDYLTQTHGVAPERVVFAPNAVDLTRIPPRERPLPDRPRIALAFTKTSGELKILRAASAGAGLGFSALGRGAGKVSATPEVELAKADIVFAAGRSALEALCAGAAVVVGDARGFAGLVTSENFETLRRQNFGRGAFVRPLDAEAVRAALDRYDRLDAERVAARARKEATVDALIDTLEALYRDAVAEASPIWSDADRAALRRFADAWPARRIGARWRWRREERAVQTFLDADA